ncbi:MAG TPA: alpha/beta fold hydrolase, partial [Spirochaetia bacterium]|nr:alpha/beta fold hydrolase [Spirochaetia bacterium]
DRLRTFIDENIPDGEKVNLVGHSMGGLVARAYAQTYGTTKVNKIVTVGSPNMGATDAYGVWEGATVWNDVWWAKVALDLTTHFGGQSNDVQTVRDFVPSMKDLLPTYDFLKLNDFPVLWSSLSQKNDYLNSLNQNISSIDTLTASIFSNSVPTNKYIKIAPPSTDDLAANRWVDGKPITGDPFEKDSGDGTVIEASAKGPFSNNILGSWWHGELVTKKENIQKIFGVLGLDITKALDSVSDDRRNVFIAAIRSPGLLEVCNSEMTLCNDQLGIYFPNEKLFILPGYSNEDLVVKVKEFGKGNYELHLGNINENSIWKKIDGNLYNDDQVDFYNVESDGFNITATFDTPPSVGVDRLITNNNSPKLTGSVDDLSAEILVKIANKTYTASNNGNGTWELADKVIVPYLTDGTYDVSVSATDTMGNVGYDKTTDELTIDTVTPTAVFKHYIDGVEFVENVAYIDSLERLSFTGEYLDASPSSGLLKDSYVIFDEQADGSFRFSQNGRKAYCSWRKKPNLVDLSGNNFSSATMEPFTNCVADLNEGGYYMAHQVYDNAIRKDIPSITQFRDVLGLHFVIDKTPPKTTVSGIDNLWHKDPVTVTFNCTDTGRSGCNKTFYAINGGDITEGSSVILSKEGQYTISYYSTDLAGNTEIALSTEKIKIDTTAPKAPKLFASNLIQRILASWFPVKTAIGYRVYYGSQSDQLSNVINTRSLFWISNVLSPGKYYVRVTAIDGAGNESVKSNVVQVKINKSWWRW